MVLSFLVVDVCFQILDSILDSGQNIFISFLKNISFEHLQILGSLFDIVGIFLAVIYLIFKLVNSLEQVKYFSYPLGC